MGDGDGRLEELAAAYGHRAGAAARPGLTASPLLAALRAAGTQHVYGDTADVRELGELVLDGRDVRREIDGNTANQPLVRKVVERYLDEGDPEEWAHRMARAGPGLAREKLLPWLYAILCGRIGEDFCRAFAAGREWEVSLQLHMALGADPSTARRVGHTLRRVVPSALVKVPFAPDAPACLLVARDLQRAGVPVNLTSTFSARQVVTAALLADVARTNVFMGRLDQGLEAELLGVHTCLVAQRALLDLRREEGLDTRLIVASMRDWRAFPRLAGCDAFTAPCKVIRELLEQDELGPADIESQLEASYDDRLGISERVREALDEERIARLYRVEPGLVEFLRELRASPQYARMQDGDELYGRFDQAGFGDLFHAPTAAERAEMERGKLPDLGGELVARVPLDTHYTLLANADFARAQAEIDALVGQRLEGHG